MNHPWDDLPCIECATPLDQAVPHDPPWPGGTHRCPGCGLVYADTLLDHIDRTEWRKVIDRDGYTVERHGDTLTVTILTPHGAQVGARDTQQDSQ